MNVGPKVPARLSRSFKPSATTVIGQFKTGIPAERQMDGIKKARYRGVQFGRRPALTDDKIAELRRQRDKGILIKDLMVRYSLSKTTNYRYLGTKET